MLSVKNLSVSYGKHQALNSVSIDVSPGEIVVILGANGAGKSSLLKSISGICEGVVSGHVSHSGSQIQGLAADEIVSQGIALVPEGRGIFPELTVIENLRLGAYAQEARLEAEDNLERVFELFPRLKERQKQRAGTMSGGEQQMVAIGRAMMSNPKILTLDEPSLGLSPLLTKELFQNLKRVKAFGLGILLVEQNARQSLAIADRGYLLENTRIIKQDSAKSLLTDPEVQAAYLGGGTAKVPRASLASGSTNPSGVSSIASSTSSTSSAYADLPRVSLTIDPSVTRTAESVLGRSIAELVGRASDTSIDGLNDASTNLSMYSARSPHSAQTDARLSSDRIEAVYLDIEQAAARALQRSRTSTSANLEPVNTPQDNLKRVVHNGSVSSSDSTYLRSNDTSDETAVQIEVYRPPRVEVYRRRDADEQFVREER